MSRILEDFFRVSRSTPIKISILYFIFGMAWIWKSDAYLVNSSNSLKTFFELSVLKGFLFIGITTFILFLFTSFQNRQILKKRTQIDETEGKYMLLFESNPVPMWVYDLQTYRFLLVNNAAIYIYGYTREEFLSMQIFDIRPKEDLHLLTQNLKEDSNNNYTFSGKWRHQRKNGDIFFVEINSHPITYQGKKAKVVMASDITKRVEVEEEIKGVVSELNNFVYRASHDIRGPLARLIGLSNLAQTDKTGNNKYNQLIHSTALLLDHVLQRLLSVNTLKEYVPEPKEINLHSLIEEIIVYLKNTNYPCEINFINEVDKNFIITTDLKIINLSLENLLENSTIYCSRDNIENPYVKINLKDTATSNFICVEDNGIGVPDKIKDNIFEMFFRGTELSKGSGLGLYIVKIAMKKIHGKVILRSSTPKKTVFELEIPKINNAIMA